MKKKLAVTPTATILLFWGPKIITLDTLTETAMTKFAYPPVQTRDERIHGACDACGTTSFGHECPKCHSALR